MADCVYQFGEWHPGEWFGDEFIFGLKDCSAPYNGIGDCNNLFIFSKPFLQSQTEIDYDLLYNYVKNDLLNTNSVIYNKESISVNAICDIYFGIKTKWLINYLLLFKEELKSSSHGVPTKDDYIRLFIKYKLNCVDSSFKKEYSKVYLRNMLMLLNIKSLIRLNITVYQYNSSLDKDPLYYIANI